MADTKLCPFCKEEIKKDAIRCKHCGEDLTSSQQKPEAKKKGNLDVKPKHLVWILLGLVSIAFWYITIPGAFVWYLYKKPEQREKVMRFLRKTFSMLRRQWKIVTPIVAAFLLIAAVRSYSAPPGRSY
jgi:uncharacterized membrane protein YvbJ